MMARDDLSDAGLDRPSAGELNVDLRHRRPLVLLATLAGAVAAAGTLVVCMALGVAGWYLTDAGAHGTPRDGLWVGALAWLMAHGSGIHVGGALVSLMPLAITMACGWATWRLGHRLGDSISGHGPDADRIADGERDWTVPVAAVLYTAGYAVVAVLTGALASTPATAPDTSRVLLWTFLLCGVLGAPAIAIGSGRAAIWTATLPASVVATAAACRRVLGTWLLVSVLAFLVALAMDFDTALNVTSQLGTDTGATAQLVVISLLVVPNAAIFSGSYLLGPGFHRRRPHDRLARRGHRRRAADVPAARRPAGRGSDPGVELGPGRGGAAGGRARRDPCPARAPDVPLGGGRPARLRRRMLAGALFGLLAVLAGGAVGPGRMTDVGPLAFSVLVHAITAFGIGGLLGGLAMTWWQRRGLEPAEEPESPSSDPQRLPSEPEESHTGSLDDPERDPDPLAPVPDPDEDESP